MYDIFYIATEKDYRFNLLQKKIPLLKIARYADYPGEGFLSAQKKCMTSFFWVITEGFKVNDDFKFDYEVPEWDKSYVHTFQNNHGGEDGIFLIPKDYHITKREAEYNFFVNKKSIDIKAGEFPPFDRFYIETPEDYFKAQEASTTPMFYAIPSDYEMSADFVFSVPKWDEKYVHMFQAEDQVSGAVNLIPKNYPITKKEAEFNFFVNKKLINKCISKPRFDQYLIQTPEDFFNAQAESTTSMFYAIDKDYKPTFDFDYNVPAYDKTYVNVFKNDSDEYNGIYLIPKEYPITKNEAKHGFFVNKKEIDIVASKLSFDIVFVSYNEPNADENWEKIRTRFPNAKRIHGVKGIHQAHIEAAKLCWTSMFWVVDGDAVIEENFDFYINVPKWDRDAVHVFRSRNPINGLTYGYGGVKLLPRQATLDMDINSVDMTTSISKKFVMVDVVSNVTNFNTDSFNTWKSAFRECVKLSSKVIDGQVDEQTQERLNVWCTVGTDKPFGEYAIKGAVAGREFGTMYADNKEMLQKINDWNWLENKFKETNEMIFKDATDINGNLVNLSDLNNKVVLVVNTATKCGFTPQFADLEKLYQTYKDKGLEVIAFPSNNFADQEPKSNEEILEFCQTTYNVTFPLMAKTDVVNDPVNPLYKDLAERTGSRPDWNFSKYLVNRSNDITYMSPKYSFDDLAKKIEEIL